MRIHNHIENQVLTDYFLIEGTVDVDKDYFINKIKKGFGEENNMNFKTNVRDLMTDYKYFNTDETFLSIVKDFISYIDDRFSMDEYRLLLKPEIYISGHNHNTYGINTIDNTLTINATSVDLNYEQKNEPIVFDIPQKVI